MRPEMLKVEMITPAEMEEMLMERSLVGQGKQENTLKATEGQLFFLVLGLDHAAAPAGRTAVPAHALEAGIGATAEGAARAPASVVVAPRARALPKRDRGSTWPIWIPGLSNTWT